MNLRLTTTAPKQGVSLALPAVITSVALVLFLFYIDEGYYSCQWMDNVGNWIMFAVYLLLVFPLQWVLAGMMHRLLRAESTIWAVFGLTLVADAVILLLIYLIV